MIYYTLKLPKASKGYFSVQRQILNEQLTPAQLRAYLFICRSLSPSLGRCWNSYNDLAKILGTSRSKAIELVAQLVKKNVIIKQKIKTRQNRRVYGDNHYTVVYYVSHRRIRKRNQGKKQGCPLSKAVLSDKVQICPFQIYPVLTIIPPKKLFVKSAVFFLHIFLEKEDEKRSIYIIILP